MRRKGQGAFEYLLLIGGVLFLTVAVITILRGAMFGTGAQVNPNVNYTQGLKDAIPSAYPATPTPSGIPTPVIYPSGTPHVYPSASASPSPTASPSASPVSTYSPSVNNTVTASASPSSTKKPTGSPTSIITTITPTPKPSRTDEYAWWLLGGAIVIIIVYVVWQMYKSYSKEYGGGA